ncbi:MAG: 50S ribosomal protein L11 methyltransferase [Planctomycetota bacterium]
MSEQPLRCFALSGPGAEAALDWLQVHAALEGVLEEGELAQGGAIVVWLHGALPALPDPAVTVTERVIRAEDYEVTGLENDAPIPVDDGLLVRPPWVARPADFSGIELVVPRGNAFGSGEHDSTKAALRVLHRTWRPVASVADVGTGSGILLAYAAARGVTALSGCDIDAPAVASARELLPQATLLVGGPDLLAPAELVVANMTGDELHAALDAILGLWLRVGALVLGGMRAPEVDGLLARVPARPVHRETLGAFTAVAFAG